MPILDNMINRTKEVFGVSDSQNATNAKYKEAYDTYQNYLNKYSNQTGTYSNNMAQAVSDYDQKIENAKKAYSAEKINIQETLDITEVSHSPKRMLVKLQRNRPDRLRQNSRLQCVMPG